MSHTLSELLNDINVSKKNLLRLDEDSSSNYPLYVVLKCLNGLDTILLVNEINIRRNIDNTQIHDFLILAIPKKKRYNKWLKSNTNPDIDLIMKFYNISRTKALVALNILTPEQLTDIKLRLNHDDTNSTSTRKKN